MNPVYVLHEYGARRHYLPHDHLQAQGRFAFEHLPPLAAPRATARDLLHGDFRKAAKNAVKTVNLGRLLAMRDQTIILGVAPFNGWIWVLEALKRHNRLILFTSWPHWALGTAVHNPLNWSLAERWWRLLEGMEVVCVTPAVAEAVARHGARTTVIPHAYDPVEFFPTPHTATRLRALFVGRMVEPKGVLDLLKTAQMLPEVDFDFVGDGELAAHVKTAADQTSNIRYLGFLKGDALRQAYQQADVLMLPSQRTPGWEELFGIAIVEAFACGATCIASDNVGPSFIIDDGVTGRLLSHADAEHMAAALSALDKNRDTLRQWQEAALKAAQDRFELGHVAEQWAEVLT